MMYIAILVLILFIIKSARCLLYRLVNESAPLLDLPDELQVVTSVSDVDQFSVNYVSDCEEDGDSEADRYFSRLTIHRVPVWKGTQEEAIVYGDRFDIAKFTVIDGDKQVLWKEPGIPRQDRTLLKVIKGAIPDNVIDAVQQAMAKFRKGLCTDRYGNPKEPVKHERGGINTWSYHVGAWTPLGGREGIVSTASLRSVKGMADFADELKRIGLFKLVDTLFERHFENLEKRFKLVNGDIRAITETFKTMAVNMEGISKPHIDGQDYGRGMCLVMPFGDYSGIKSALNTGLV